MLGMEIYNTYLQTKLLLEPGDDEIARNEISYRTNPPIRLLYLTKKHAYQVPIWDLALAFNFSLIDIKDIIKVYPADMTALRVALKPCFSAGMVTMVMTMSGD